MNDVKRAHNKNEHHPGIRGFQTIDKEVSLNISSRTELLKGVDRLLEKKKINVTNERNLTQSKAKIATGITVWL